MLTIFKPAEWLCSLYQVFGRDVSIQFMLDARERGEAGRTQKRRKNNASNPLKFLLLREQHWNEDQKNLFQF